MYKASKAKQTNGVKEKTGTNVKTHHVPIGFP
jgi:hypothetical protein